MLGALNSEDIRDVLKIEMVTEPKDLEQVIKGKEIEMKNAARELQFELAALLRDEVKLLKEELRKSTPKKK
jgi:excinuclease UvrABC helicase subunit UvrB